MNPYNYSEEEVQRLRDEVTYLHSLWYQGPSPHSNPNPNPNPNYSSFTAIPIANNNNRMTFPDAGPPWPSPVPAPAPPLWRDPRPVSRPPPPANPATEAARLQRKATGDFRELFVKSGSEDELGDGSDEEDEDYWSDLGDEKFQFFLRTFTEDGELRRYYEENCDGGEFYCPVCGAVGKKGSGKWFKTCLGLVQHASAVSKTERNHSHRAFVQVVCKVLGWDSDRIPVVVLKGEPLGRSIGNGGVKTQDESVGGDGNDKVVASSGLGESVAKQGGSDDLLIDDGKLMDFEGNIECEDSNRCVKNASKTGTTEVAGNGNEAVIDLSSKGKNDVINLEEDEDPSEDGEQEDEDEDPSEDGEQEDEEEDPSEDGNEDEYEDDDPSEVEEEDTSEDGTKYDNKDESDGASENLRPLDQQGIEKPQVCTLEWPVWPTSTRDLASAANSLSAEEQAMFAADQLQHKAIKVCRDFLVPNSTFDSNDFDDDDGDSSESGGSEGEDSDPDMSDDSEQLNFFLKLFSEDAKLRGFYTNNYASGDFCCLVCGGIGKKVWKRFKGCVALVQHSSTISNTEKKRAHRAYGQAICQVLSWDMNQFPSISMRRESHLPKLHNSQTKQGEADEINGEDGGRAIEDRAVDQYDTSLTH